MAWVKQTSRKRKRVKKTLFCVALLLVLTSQTTIGLADSIGSITAVIDGKSSERVHLRERPAKDAKSLGLYYTGTEVQCGSAPSAKWTRVVVGAQEGYIKSEYLYTGPDLGRVSPKQPTGIADNQKRNSWVNLRAAPIADAEVLSKIDNGTAVTILGETANRWYYVRVGGHEGYMMSNLVLVGNGTPSGAPAARGGFRMQQYTEVPNPGGSIRIQYPAFSGKGADTLNVIVDEEVRMLAWGFKRHMVQERPLAADFQAAVTLYNSKMASIVFWGWYDAGSGDGYENPRSLLTALNIDLSTMAHMRLRDLYAVNAGFEEIFLTKSYFPTKPNTSFDAGIFFEMRKYSTREYNPNGAFYPPDRVQCFLKPEGIVISVGAPRTTGSDHFEAQLRYSDIQPYYLPAQRYWED